MLKTEILFIISFYIYMAVTTQITQISDPGLSLSTAMVNAGLTTFNKIEQTNARELELVRIASTENDCN